MVILANPEETKQKPDSNPEKTGSQANRKPITDNRKTINKHLSEESDMASQFDSDRIIPLWNSLGCAQHRGLTAKADKALDKTYKAYCKGTDNPKELNDWLESYLMNGFANWITSHHRQMNDGKWCADLEFAVRYDTYDKIKNSVVK